MIFIALLIAVGVIIFLIINYKKKNQKEKVEGVRNFNPEKTLLHEEGNYAISIDYSRKKFSLSDKNKPVIIESFDNIKDVKVNVDGETKLKGVLAGAIVGELLVGKRGILLGAIGLSKEVNYVKSVDLIIEFKTGHHKTFIVNFFTGDLKKYRTEHYVNQAEEWFNAINELKNFNGTPKTSITEDDEFEFIVEDVFTITGRGLVAAGLVTKGYVKKGDNDIILKNDNGKTFPIEIIGVEKNRKITDRANKDESVGIIIKGVTIEQIFKGDKLMLNKKQNSYV